jgi:hypothetical protein
MLSAGQNIIDDLCILTLTEFQCIYENAIQRLVSSVFIGTKEDTLQIVAETKVINDLFCTNNILNQPE